MFLEMGRLPENAGGILQFQAGLLVHQDFPKRRLPSTAFGKGKAHKGHPVRWPKQDHKGRSLSPNPGPGLSGNRTGIGIPGMGDDDP